MVTNSSFHDFQDSGSLNPVSGTFVQLESRSWTFPIWDEGRQGSVAEKSEAKGLRRQALGSHLWQWLTVWTLGKFSTSLNLSFLMREILVMRVRCNNVSKMCKIPQESIHSVHYPFSPFAVFSLFLLFWFFLVIIGTWQMLVQWFNRGAGGLINSCPPSSSH